MGVGDTYGKVEDLAETFGGWCDKHIRSCRRQTNAGHGTAYTSLVAKLYPLLIEDRLVMRNTCPGCDTGQRKG